MVFVTGATGFIGSALRPRADGRRPPGLGLARSDAGAHSLAAAGAQVHRGDSKTWKACAAEPPPRMR